MALFEHPQGRGDWLSVVFIHPCILACQHLRNAASALFWLLCGRASFICHIFAAFGCMVCRFGRRLGNSGSVSGGFKGGYYSLLWRLLWCCGLLKIVETTQHYFKPVNTFYCRALGFGVLQVNCPISTQHGRICNCLAKQVFHS